MGLLRGVEDATYPCHSSFYDYHRRHGTSVIIIENVPQYCKDIVLAELPPPDFALQWAILDPRLFGDGAARPRFYGIAFRTKDFAWRAHMSLEKFLGMLLARTQMSAQSYFWMNISKGGLSKNQATGLDHCFQLSVFMPQPWSARAHFSHASLHHTRQLAHFC